MSAGQNTMHDSAISHVTGKSIFIDDRPKLNRELLVGVVGTPIASGEILEIDASAALSVPGVVGVFTAKHLAHKNWGTIVHDQPILVDRIIGYRDEPVALIAAETQQAIDLARKKITIKTRALPAVYTIDEALEKQQFLHQGNPFIRGDFASAYAAAPHRIESEFECGGQEHFYMENQASIAYPLENGQMEVHSSSQHPSETQRVVCEAIGAQLHQVVCVVKRMGGGFGGKESQAAHFASLAALVAKYTQRPARLVLTKDEDMQMTGKRHPFKIKTQVGFDEQGRFLAFKAHIYADGGAYTDLTPSILERAMFHIDNGYYLPVCEIHGAALKTNNHSNTAFRGFGGPQGAFAIENVIEEMAQVLKIDSVLIRQRNLYGRAGLKTPYGQEVEGDHLAQAFEKVLQTSNYLQRRQEIQAFNVKNQGKLRGLSLTTTKFGIAFTAKFLNQGNALVNVHLDGTVQVSTGATEMGQGVNTKIAQVVAEAFGIPTQHVQIMPTSTEKNHNTSPTAASSGADINCAAAFLACDKIRKRMMTVAHKHFSGDPMDFLREWEVDERLNSADFEFKNQLITHRPSGKSVAFDKVVGLAYMNRISLGDYAHFKTQNLGFDKDRGIGRPFNYYTNGATVSEIEIDEFTGVVKVLRADIVMDLGRMINPGIDEGQVAGAFVQAMGWVTTENLYYGQDRKLLSHSPTTYKIPNIQDTPREFNISFIENDTNSQNIRKSKAVGEPPFLLGISVWTAIKDALMARTQKRVEIKSPATNEEVLMALTRSWP